MSYCPLYLFLAISMFGFEGRMWDLVVSDFQFLVIA